MNRKHSRARSCDIDFIPKPEYVLLHVIENSPYDLEENEELICHLLPPLQWGKKKIKHICAEGVEPFHPITPFSL